MQKVAVYFRSSESFALDDSLDLRLVRFQFTSSLLSIIRQRSWLVIIAQLQVNGYQPASPGWSTASGTIRKIGRRKRHVHPRRGPDFDLRIDRDTGLYGCPRIYQGGAGLHRDAVLHFPVRGQRQIQLSFS